MICRPKREGHSNEEALFVLGILGHSLERAPLTLIQRGGKPSQAGYV